MVGEGDKAASNRRRTGTLRAAMGVDGDGRRWESRRTRARTTTHPPTRGRIVIRGHQNVVTQSN